ncbi:unnamed protein product [Anisakis simplex]|uniref:Uncharacterized protein n=1 Tax=Anisakis simplex TaxID=6269 RepID=A0A0M3J231_ANISI|nr:unnamed protein product [Anisakis simplex]
MTNDTHIELVRFAWLITRTDARLKTHDALFTSLTVTVNVLASKMSWNESDLFDGISVQAASPFQLPYGALAQGLVSESRRGSQGTVSSGSASSLGGTPSPLDQPTSPPFGAPTNLVRFRYSSLLILILNIHLSSKERIIGSDGWKRLKTLRITKCWNPIYVHFSVRIDI